MRLTVEVVAEVVAVQMLEAYPAMAAMVAMA
jgi:hypothetical protein